MLAAHTIPGIEIADTDRGVHTRTVELEGAPCVIEVSLRAAGVRARAIGGAVPSPEQMASMVSFWFDLATDIAHVDTHLADSAVLVEDVRARPGVRVTRFVDQFEASIATVLGQQVSLAAGRRFLGRLAAAYGEPIPDDSRTNFLLFPTPHRIVSIPVDELRATLSITGARAATLHDVADLFASGFQLDSPHYDSLEELRQVRGIGPWTTRYLAIRALGRPDEFPASDAVVSRVLRTLDVGDSDVTQTWAPYRSYAAARLWTHDPQPVSRGRSAHE